MMLLVPVPWSRWVWVLPLLTTLCRPAKPGGRRRPKTRVDGVRPMRQQVRRWLPAQRLVLVVDGGVRRVALALACVKNRGAMVSRLRWDAALSHPPGPQSPGKPGPNPLQGQRQRSLQHWAERSDPPWETVEVDCYGGQRTQLGVCSRTALGDTPRWPPVAIRSVLVAAPEGTLRMAACFCPDLAATPLEILPWVVMRWSLAVTCEEGRAPLGLETQRPWLDQAIARTTPVLLALGSLVTLLALPLRHDGAIPVPVTAWSPKTAPTFADCLAVVRRHLWRVRYVMNSAPEADILQWPQEALDRLIHGLPSAA